LGETVPKRKSSKKLANLEAEALRTFSENLRALRVESGFTQQQLAADTRLSVSYISMLERGERNPSVTLVARLADALNALPRALIG